MFCAKQRTKDFSKKVVDKLKKRVYSCLANKARGQKQKQKKLKNLLTSKQVSVTM
nr:MAG TPA: hypothetical protein [Bacteriophage sp.]